MTASNGVAAIMEDMPCPWCDMHATIFAHPCILSCLLPPTCESLFFRKEMELSLIGLQNAGKSSLVNVLTTGSFHQDMIPTVRLFGAWGVGEGAIAISSYVQDHGFSECRCRHSSSSCSSNPLVPNAAGAQAEVAATAARYSSRTAAAQHAASSSTSSSHSWLAEASSVGPACRTSHYTVGAQRA